MTEVQTTDAVRLNLGGGDGSIDVPGFTTIDRKTGGEAYPLAYPDGSVDEIRASHILEHWSHREVTTVLTDWLRALKPGGRLRVAVPNFEWVCQEYMKGKQINVQGFLMGGHVDANDKHGVLFDKDLLAATLKSVGFENIGPWVSEVKDTATLDVSLNLQGFKPDESKETEDDRLADQGLLPEQKRSAPVAAGNPLGCKVIAVISVPRLIFSDFMWDVLEQALPLGVQLKRSTGVFWTQGIQNVFEEHQPDADYLLAMDYDTVFHKSDIVELIRHMQTNAGIDALCACQIRRESQFPLFTLKNDIGNPVTKIEVSWIERELLPLTKGTAHFGLTCIRTSSLKRMPLPWFLGVPSPDGTWHKDDAHLDPDVYFWKHWADTGNTLFQANRVKVGHLELDITWPDRNMRPIRQKISEYRDLGKPVEAAS